MDILDFILWGFVTTTLTFISFLVGRFLDPIWRAKQLRKLFKKNYIVVALVSKDLRTIQERVVNADKDIIEIDDKFWVIKQGAIFRKDKSQAKGYEKTFITKKNIKWQEEVPVIYLSEDNLKPLNFWKDESGVKPVEIASVLKGWIANQRAKDIQSQKQQFIFTILILVSVVVIAYLVWQNYDTLQTIKSQLGVTTQAVKTIIEQPKG